MHLVWKIKRFDELSALEIYQILQLREMVFIIEQACIYQDIGNKDLGCYHLWAEKDGQMVAYTRLVPPDLSYPNETSIGRVLSHPKYRRHKIGRQLVTFAIEAVSNLYPRNAIRISAQEYLIPFYESYDFVQVSQVYIEDHLPHAEMLLSKKH